MNPGSLIQWDIPKMRRLQIAYDAAVADGRDQFTFEQHQFLTSYAKYLLEFLHGRLRG